MLRPSIPLPLIALLVLIASTAWSASFEEVETPARPNIVLCMADDQGWGDVGYSGASPVLTPVLDEMAASALRFDRFSTASSVCSPTRGSVLTGRHPNRFGCFSWGYELRPQEVTIAEALQQAGYATGHFGKWHLGPVQAGETNSPDTSGFDVFVSSPNFYENDPRMSQNGQVVELKGESSMVTVEAALEFIRVAAEQDRPFLAVIWFGSPHTPHEATDETRAHYADLPERLQHYYGEITGIDTAMGHLREQLRELELADETLLWYTSDNGPQGPDDRRPGSTGGLRGRKGTAWEGGLRVPTIIEWPARIPEPRVTEIPCSTVDIYPTLLELAGVTVPNQPEPIDGLSLVPLIDGEMKARPGPLGFWDHFPQGRPVRSTEILKQLQEAQADGRTLPPEPSPNDEAAAKLIALAESGAELPGHAAWIEGPYKLHRRPDSSGTVYELYNLTEDPAETTDLADQEPERVDRMKAALAAWQGSVLKSLKGEDYR
ncbi:sulfatase-like hydrolase/transferase [soil metagenome]